MGCMDWIYLAQWRAFVKTVMNLRVSIKCWGFLEFLSGCWCLRKDLPRAVRMYCRIYL